MLWFSFVLLRFWVGHLGDMFVFFSCLYLGFWVVCVSFSGWSVFEGFGIVPFGVAFSFADFFFGFGFLFPLWGL